MVARAYSQWWCTLCSEQELGFLHMGGIREVNPILARGHVGRRQRPLMGISVNALSKVSKPV